MHTLEEIFVSEERSETQNVMTTVEIRVQEAVLTAIENLVISRVETTMESAVACSERKVDRNVLELDQSAIPRNMEDLQRTASSKINSRTDLNSIDDTRGDITVREDNLLVNEENINQQTHTYHMVTGQNASQENLGFLSGHVPTHCEPRQPRI